MTLTTALATKLFIFIMKFLTPSVYDVKYEELSHREERMQMVAESIANSSHKATCTENYKIPGCKRIYGGSPEMLAMIVLRFAYQESNLAEYVHSNKCANEDHQYKEFWYKCDAYRNRNGELKHRAIGLWQLHSSKYLIPQEKWEQMGFATYEATQLSSNLATGLIIGYTTQYGLAGAFKKYNNRNPLSEWKQADYTAKWVNINVGKLFN
jgi:hypothetical protein